jgi:GTP cyclohydrolase II
MGTNQEECVKVHSGRVGGSVDRSATTCECRIKGSSEEGLKQKGQKRGMMVEIAREGSSKSKIRKKKSKDKQERESDQYQEQESDNKQ